MAAGDIIQEFGFRKRTVKLKTGTGCAKGDVLAWDTDGYAPADADAAGANIGPFFVALETVVGKEGVQEEVQVLEEGVVEVAKVTGAINDGDWVGLSTTAGKVTAFSKPDAPASYSEAGMQAELDKVFKRVGRAYGSAASADATVKIRLLSY
jgi:hypothetical protein